MADFFELTAYCKNGLLKSGKVDLSDIIKTSEKVSFDVVNHGGYTAYTVNFEDLEIHTDTLDTLAEIAKIMLDKLNDSVCVSGVYELTGYNLIGINTLNKLDSILFKFPLLFFRRGEEKNNKPYKTINDIVIVYNEKTQDLFGNCF